MSLYHDILQQDFARLPTLGRRLHGGSDTRWAGRVDVRRGGGRWLGPLLDVAGLPRAGRHLLCEVRVAVDGAGEHWQRRIGACSMPTRQRRVGNTLVESTRGLGLYLQLRLCGSQLLLRSRGARWCGLPLPTWLQPVVLGRESVRNGMFCFSVRFMLPLLGCVLAYRGRLAPLGTGDEERV